MLILLFLYRQQSIGKPNPIAIKIIIHHDQVEFIPSTQDWFNIQKLINIVHHANRQENHTVLWRDAGNALDLLILNTLRKLGLE